MSWTARGDVAEAAAIVLASNGSYNGPITLTAGDAPTFADIASIASRIAGKSVTSTVTGAETWLAAGAQAGQPEPMAQFTLGIYLAAAGGYFAGTDPLLRTLLQREPSSVFDVLL